MPPLRYPWTPELDAALREGYAKARSCRMTTAAVDIVVKMSGYPRHIVLMRAQTLRLSRDHRRPWMTREIAYLRAHAGRVGLRQISNALGRRETSVRAQMERLALQRRVQKHGYTLEQAACVLGVCKSTVSHAVRTGKLGVGEERRITARMLANFFWRNFATLDLRLIDQAWLKERLAQQRKGPLDIVEGKGCVEANGQ